MCWSTLAGEPIAFSSHAEAIEDGELGKQLEKAEPGGPGLVRWLLQTGRGQSEWLLLDKKDRLPWLGTPFQFFLVKESSAKERDFTAAAKK